MIGTIQIARLLEGLTEIQQHRACKYSPTTGNIYVYRNARAAGMFQINAFVSFVELISNTKRENLISCSLSCVNENVAGFFVGNSSENELTHLITVDSSKVVIVD